MNFKNMLKKINEKSKKPWSMDKVKSIAKGYSKKDLNKGKNLESLIEDVAKAAGIKISDEKLANVKDKVMKNLGKK